MESKKPIDSSDVETTHDERPGLTISLRKRTGAQLTPAPPPLSKRPKTSEGASSSPVVQTTKAKADLSTAVPSTSSPAVSTRLRVSVLSKTSTAPRATTEKESKQATPAASTRSKASFPVTPNLLTKARSILAPLALGKKTKAQEQTTKSTDATTSTKGKAEPTKSAPSTRSRGPVTTTTAATPPTTPSKAVPSSSPASKKSKASETTHSTAVKPTPATPAASTRSKAVTSLVPPSLGKNQKGSDPVATPVPSPDSPKAKTKGKSSTAPEKEKPSVPPSPSTVQPASPQTSENETLTFVQATPTTSPTTPATPGGASANKAHIYIAQTSNGKTLILHMPPGVVRAKAGGLPLVLKGVKKSPATLVPNRAVATSGPVVRKIAPKTVGSDSGPNTSKKPDVKEDEGSMSCKLCTSTFSSKSGLDKHITQHLEYRPYHCVLCNQLFTSEQETKEHLLQVHCNKVYKCGECKLMLASKDIMSCHLDDHLGDIFHTCVSCNKLVDGKKLNDHVAKHTAAKPYICLFCHEESSEHETIVDHMKAHSEEEELGPCRKCKEKCKPEDVIKHMSLHGDQWDNPNSCDLCHDNFASLDALRKHFIDKHCLKVSGKPCGICQKTFSDRNAMLDHAVVEHSEVFSECQSCYFSSREDIDVTHVEEHVVRFNRCKLCGLDKENEKDLYKHLSFHASSEEPELQCVQCQKLFTEGTDLLLHACNAAGTDKSTKFNCVFCVDTLATRKDLYEHVAMHISVQFYKCRFCDQHLDDTEDLLSHVQRDTVETNPFRCFICQWVVSADLGLRTHVMNHFLGTASMCPLCHKEVAPSEVKMHLISHLVKRYYTCMFCLKAVSNPGLLYNHIKTHTLRTPYLCITCDTRFPSLEMLQKHARDHVAKKFAKGNSGTQKGVGKSSSLKGVFTRPPLPLSSPGGIKAITKAPSPVQTPSSSAMSTESMSDSDSLTVSPRKKPRPKRIFPRSLEEDEEMDTTVDDEETESDEDMPSEEGMETPTLASGRDSSLEALSIGNSPGTELDESEDSFTDRDSVYMMKCLLCLELLPGEEFETHIESHMEDTLHGYICSECQHEFPDNDSVSKHMLAKHFSDSGIKCNICDEIIQDSPQKHMKEHLAEESYRCKACRLVCSVRELDEHIQSHIKKSVYQCMYCAELNTDKEKIIQHMKDHKEVKVTCRFCLKKINKSDIASHIAKHDWANMIRCGICLVEFQRLDLVKAHISVKHIIKPRKSLHCGICKERFTGQQKYLAHIASEHIHSGKLCTICEEILPDDMNAAEHLREHCIRIRQCEECGMKVTSNTRFYDHLVECSEVFDSADKKLDPAEENDNNYEGRKKEKMQSESENSGSPQSGSVSGASEIGAGDATVPTVKPTSSSEDQENSSTEKPANSSTEAEKIPEKPASSSKKPDSSPEIANSTGKRGDRRLNASLRKGQSKIHQCTRCEESFESVDELLDHGDEHGDTASTRGRHKCALCKKWFGSEAELKKHVPVHLTVVPTKCQVCDKVVKGTELKSHVIDHLESTYYTCIICLDLMLSEADLDEHYSTHFIVLPTQCKICGITLSDILNLQLHFKIHVKRAIQPAQPLELGISSVYSEENLPQLINAAEMATANTILPILQQVNMVKPGTALVLPAAKTKVLNSQTMAVLPTSPMSTPSQRTSTRQKQPFNKTVTRMVDTRTQPLNFLEKSSSKSRMKCKVCCKLYFNQKALGRHERTHKMVGGNCPLCHQTYQTKKLLELHMKQHLSQDHYSCPVCDQGFLSQGYLSIHMKYHGFFKRVQTCHLCFKGFLSTSALVSHSCKPLLKGKFTCTLCNRTFENQKLLENHMKTHYESKVLICPKCDRKCPDKYAFKNHKKRCKLLKSGNIPPRMHQCGVCDEFIKGDVMVHLRKHTEGNSTMTSDENSNAQNETDLMTDNAGDLNEHPDKEGDEDQAPVVFVVKPDEPQNENTEPSGPTSTEENPEPESDNETEQEPNVENPEVGSLEEGHELEPVDVSIKQEGSMDDSSKTELSDNELPPLEKLPAQEESNPAPMNEEVQNPDTPKPAKKSKPAKNKLKPMLVHNCNICFKLFPSEESLQSHMDRHEPDAKPSALQIYMRRRPREPVKIFPNSDGKYECDVCNKVMDTKRKIVRHLRRHIPVKNVQCRFCNLTFDTKRETINHERSHKEPRPFNCTLCNKTFLSKYSVKVHMETHNEDTPFLCQKCGESFKTKRKLALHCKDVHAGQKVKPVSERLLCPHCPKTFMHKHSLEGHIRYVHTTGTPSPCDVCGKVFKHPKLLMLHQTVHEENKYPCDQCGAKLRTKALLKRHIKIHNGQMDFTCHLCGKAFVERGPLRVHLARHSAERPFKCNICNKGFKTKGCVKTHMAVHSSEYPFTCDICGAGCKTHSRKLEHERRHSKVKEKMPCGQCGKLFATQSSLQVHIREVHEGKRETCLLCGSKFRRPMQLEQHTQACHPTVLYEVRPRSLLPQPAGTESVHAVSEVVEEQVVAVQTIGSHEVVEMREEEEMPTHHHTEMVELDGMVTDTVYECGLCKAVITGDLHQHLAMHQNNQEEVILQTEIQAFPQ